MRDIIMDPLFELLHLQPEEALEIAEGKEGYTAAIAHADLCEYCGWLVQNAKDFLDGKHVTKIPEAEMREMVRKVLGRDPVTF